MVAVAERLYRSRDDRMLAGVAAGVAEMLDADPSLVRILWALLTIFTGGLAFLVYIVMAIVVPVAPPGYETTRPTGFGTDGSVGGGGAPGSAGGASAAGFAGGADAAGAADAAPGPPPGGRPAGQAPSYWTTDREARRAARRARRNAGEPGRGGIVGGVVLIIIGGFFLVREFVPWFDWHLWWPIGLIALGGLLLVLAMRPGQPSD
jgi:phage shock protein PspC (stress-responsive transcriptional regulator)